MWKLPIEAGGGRRRSLVSSTYLRRSCRQDNAGGGDDEDGTLHACTTRSGEVLRVRRTVRAVARLK